MLRFPEDCVIPEWLVIVGRIGFMFGCARHCTAQPLSMCRELWVRHNSLASALLYME
jgi:hypothetical protein